VFLSRLFLVALLERRNDILAKSIRDACSQAAKGSSVVAILGAAHLNGIQQRLVEDEPLTGIEGGVNARDVVI
jgi:pheromone shutdown protein TraB